MAPVGIALGERAGGELEALATHLDRVATCDRTADHFALDLDDDRGHEVAHHLALLERLLDRLVELARVAWKCRVGFGPAVAVAAVVLEDALPQAALARLLVGRLMVVSTRIPLTYDGLAVLLVDGGAGHFGDVVGAEGEGLALVDVQAQRLGERLLVLVSGKPADLVHPAQDILLALLRPLEVGKRVLARRRLRQAGEHGGLGHGQVREALAEIDVGRRGRTRRRDCRGRSG
jgi:hypothetical protein